MFEEIMAKTNESNPMSIVAYLWFIGAIIVLVQNPTDKFLKFHAWQSIFLSAAQAAVWVVLNIVISSMGYGYYGGFGLFSLVMPVLSLLFLVAWIMCVMKAYKGETYKLPVIGDMAEKQAAK